jgi:hypothetical protein
MNREGVAADGGKRPGGPIFLHAMWRTGSSYLLSRFECPGYLTFYEPFNGEIGSAHGRSRARALYAEKHRQLRHPTSETGYFDRYDAQEPLTGRPLWSFTSPQLPIYDVYNRLSVAGEALLAACVRLADSRELTPVFGFCHSGTQIATMRARFGGRHVYLTRAPREQFLSYAPAANDFFCAATCLQLLCSEQLRPAALTLAPELRYFAGPAPRALFRKAPHRLTMKLARAIRARLDAPALYRLFYLSWLASNAVGRDCCEDVVSLRELHGDRDRRAGFEQKFGIRFDGLNVEASNPDVLSIPFTELEGEVEAASGYRGATEIPDEPS